MRYDGKKRSRRYPKHTCGMCKCQKQQGNSMKNGTARNLAKKGFGPKARRRP